MELLLAQYKMPLDHETMLNETSVQKKSRCCSKQSSSMFSGIGGQTHMKAESSCVLWLLKHWEKLKVHNGVKQDRHINRKVFQFETTSPARCSRCS